METSQTREEIQIKVRKKDSHFFQSLSIFPTSNSHVSFSSSSSASSNCLLILGGYVNPSRHLSTGGPQRTKLTPEELEAKMQKAKEANAALVKRQEEIDKDKAAFNELTAQDRKAREEASKKKIAEKKAQVSDDWLAITKREVSLNPQEKVEFLCLKSKFLIQIQENKQEIGRECYRELKAWWVRELPECQAL